MFLSLSFFVFWAPKKAIMRMMFSLTSFNFRLSSRFFAESYSFSRKTRHKGESKGRLVTLPEVIINPPPDNPLSSKNK
jgi:hypothetical protein